MLRTPKAAVVLILGLTLCPFLPSVALGDEGFVALYPELKTLPAPAGLKEGLRITYYSSIANMAGGGDYFWRDDKGEWVGQNKEDKDKLYGHGDQGGQGGHGYTLVDVAALGEKAVLQITSLGLDPTSGAVIPIATQGVVGLPSSTAEYWINPKVLKDPKEMATPEVKIVKMPYKIGDRSFQSIRFQRTQGTSRQVWVFDLETGVLLHTNSCIQTQEAKFSWAGTRTTLSQSTLRDIRQLNLPWAAGEVPDWVANVKTLKYEGGYTMSQTGVGQMTLPLAAELAVTDRGKNWLRYRQTTTISSQNGVPPTVTEETRISGIAQIGGLWLPPGSIKDLAVGTVIDKDPVTGFQVSVTANAAGADGTRVVVFTETGEVYSMEWHYNGVSGMLMRIKRTEKTLIGQNVLDANLGGVNAAK